MLKFLFKLIVIGVIAYALALSFGIGTVVYVLNEHYKHTPGF